MYDLEILVPAETAVEAIKIRFNDFKKWGLLNIKERKIKLILACSPNNDLNFLKSDWPENVDVEVLETPYKHVAQRIYFYYSDYAKPNTAKWYQTLQ